MHGESGPGARRAVDGEAAAMAIENVLDQRQTQPGAALRATFGDIDAIEPFGQPRQMFRRDARAVIADTDAGFRFALGRCAGTKLDVDPASGSAIFERIFDQIFENADQLVMVAEHRQGAGIFDVDGDTAVARQALEPVGYLANYRH